MERITKGSDLPKKKLGSQSIQQNIRRSSYRKGHQLHILVVEPRSTRDIPEMLFKLIVKVTVVGIHQIPLGCYPFKGNLAVPTGH